MEKEKNEVFDVNNFVGSNVKGKYYGGVLGWVLMKLNLFFVRR